MADETITLEEADAQVRAMARLFGLMFYHFSDLAVERMGGEEGKAFIEEAVKRFGLDRSRRVRDEVLKMGLKPTLENYDKVLDLPSLGWGGDTKETFCPFAEVWFKKGATELCKPYCEVDIWKFVDYNPDIKVKRLSWVLEGDDDCQYDIHQE